MDLHATSPLALLRGDPGASANELLEKFKRYIDESEKVRMARSSAFGGSQLSMDDVRDPRLTLCSWMI